MRNIGSMRLWVLLFVASLAVTAAFRVEAASFDCARAGTPIETAICADPALGALDDRLAALYRDDYRALSAKRKPILRANELAWLKTMNDSCKGTAVAACVRSAYRARLEALPVTVRGSYVFYWEGGIVDGVPIMDSPDGVNARRWNQMVSRIRKQTGPDSDGGGVTQVVFDLGAADDGLLALRATVNHRFTGAATWDSVAEGHEKLLPAWRSLTAGDLFAIHPHWSDALVPLVRQRGDIKGQYSDAEIADVIAHPSNWLVRRTGLDIAIGNLDNQGWKTVVLPWSDLRPFLSPNPAFAIPP